MIEKIATFMAWLFIGMGVAVVLISLVIVILFMVHVLNWVWPL